MPTYVLILSVRAADGSLFWTPAGANISYSASLTGMFMQATAGGAWSALSMFMQATAGSAWSALSMF